MVFGGSNPKPKDPSDEVFRKIFVGGLDLEVTTEGMSEYFAKFGEIVDCIVVKNAATQRSKGFGFVTFKEAAAVDNVQANRPHVIQNKEVEVKRAMPRDESDNLESHVTTAKLFIGNLRKDATEEDLVQQFSAFGDIESAEVARIKDTGVSRGFGFVTYQDYDSVDKAMLNRPHSVKSSLVDVRKGLSKEEMQKIRMRQQYYLQQQQQQHQQQQQYGYQQQQFGPPHHQVVPQYAGEFYPAAAAPHGAAWAGGPPATHGGFGYYGNQGGFVGGQPAVRGGYWQRGNPYRGGGGGRGRGQ